MTPGNVYLLPTNLPVSYHCPEAMGQLFLHITLTIQLSGEQIAHALFISPSRLHKRFKAETGITLGAIRIS